MTTSDLLEDHGWLSQVSGGLLTAVHHTSNESCIKEDLKSEHANPVDPIDADLD